MANQRRKVALASLLFTLPLSYSAISIAAKPIDLSHQSANVLRSLVTQGEVSSATGIKEISRNVDRKKNLHVRIQEMHQGFPVWGGDAVLHIPNSDTSSQSLAGILAKTKTMDGTYYQDLSPDLGKVPAELLQQEYSQQAIDKMIANYQHHEGTAIQTKDHVAKVIVFVDKANKAHWAYQVSLYVEPSAAGHMPAKPVYLIDAKTFQVYEQWNDIKTLEEEAAAGGGFGGNKKMGKMTYDGAEDHLPTLKIQFDKNNHLCLLKNADVIVKNYRTGSYISFDCAKPDDDHNSLYWDGELDAVNGGYSPGNDALFGGAVIKDMYQNWYNVPVLKNPDGTPMLLTMVVHDPIDNAYWDGRRMTFGDGVSMFYPLTSLGVAAHEISHGFTEQHSDLAYYGQSGGMNEAFSDIAAQAAEVFAYGKNSWQIGPEIFKAENQALRYMDQPSKDCHGRTPGNWCSIDDASQYVPGIDVHFSSGVYNRFFYLLGTAKGWDVRKAFDVMVQANSNYWTSTTNFANGACGVIKGAKDLGYGIRAIKKAFATVKVETDNC